MFFILSKLLFFLLVPFHWILFLLIWIWRTRSPRRKRQLGMVTLLIALLFTNPFLYRSLVISWQPPVHHFPDSPTYEVAVLLGGMAGYDRNHIGYFGNTADRFIQTANLYHRGIVRKIIVSGGTGSLVYQEPAEADFLFQQLVYNGVKATDVLIERKARNTHENAVYSKQLLNSLGLPGPYVLITSALHMPRSAAVFKKAGLPFVALPCDYKVYSRKFALEDYFVPDVALLDEWSLFIKEIVGLYVYRFTGKA